MDPVTELLTNVTSAELGKAMGVSAWRVAKWRQRNRIPPEHWQAVVRVSARTDYPVTLEDLAKSVAGE